MYNIIYPNMAGKSVSRLAGALTVNKNNPLAKGLVLTHTCSSLRECSKIFGEQFAPTSTPTVRSRGLFFSADAQYVSAPITGTNNIRTDLPITVLVIGNCTVSTITRKRLLRLSEPVNGTVVSLDFADGTSNVLAFGVRYGTSTFSVASTTGFTPAANKRYVLVGRHKPNTYPELYVDGLLKGTSITLATMHLPPTVATIGSNGGTFTFNGTAELVLIWNRYLSEAEIKSISANPYQVFSKHNLASQFLLIAASTTSVYSDLALRWDCLNIINSDSSLRYDILNTIASDSTLKFDINTIITSDSSLRWDMAGTVSSDLTTRFDILNQIASDLGLRFDILQGVSSDIILKFDLNNMVQSDITALWNMAGGVWSDCTIRYAINQDAGVGYFIIQADSDKHAKYNRHKNYKRRYKVI